MAYNQFKSEIVMEKLGIELELKTFIPSSLPAFKPTEEVV